MTRPGDQAPARRLFASIRASVGVRFPDADLDASRLGTLAATAGGTGAGVRPEREAAALQIAGPDDLGPAYQSALDRDRRRAGGVFFTPPAVAERLVAGAAAQVSGALTTVCDPAVGAGAFLLAAARLRVGRGEDPARVVATLFGADLDPLAIAVAEVALVWWALEAGVEAGDLFPLPGLVEADGLHATPALWPTAPRDGFDLVVGNPPFLGQLARSTARTPDEAEAARRRFAGAAHRYADTAGLFLVQACTLTRPGGAACMVQPVSVLGAADAEGVRRAVDDGGELVGLWVGGGGEFDAAVQVCAPVVAVGGGSPRGVVEVFSGTGSGGSPSSVVRAPGLDWSALLAGREDVPEVDVAATDVLGAVAEATAGFRDQYYGIAPFVHEARRGEPEGGELALVTAGAIDPGVCRWGVVPVRFGGRRWTAPVLAADRLGAADVALGAWAQARAVPKLLVATQTRVLEAVVDRGGVWFPSVPVIAVVPTGPVDLDHLLAVLLAPPVSAWARRKAAGTGLSARAVRVSARLLRDVPLPVDADAWHEGADLASGFGVDPAESAEASRGRLLALGSVMTRAYRSEAAVERWWRSQLPRPARSPHPGSGG